MTLKVKAMTLNRKVKVTQNEQDFCPYPDAGFPPFPQDQIPGPFQGFSRAEMAIFQGRDSRHSTRLKQIIAFLSAKIPISIIGDGH